MGLSLHGSLLSGVAGAMGLQPVSPTFFKFLTQDPNHQIRYLDRDDANQRHRYDCADQLPKQCSAFGLFNLLCIAHGSFLSKVPVARRYWLHGVIGCCLAIAPGAAPGLQIRSCLRCMTASPKPLGSAAGSN